MKARIFNVMQYEKHPETGEVLLTEDTIKVALAHKTVSRWAYIKHDGEVYTERDEADDPEHKTGATKPAHWHIVIECAKSATEVGTIAKWLKIKDNYVDVAKGAGAFLDCCRYLTHEDLKQQAAGKRLYSDDQVRHSDNFNFRAELDRREEQQAKYGRGLSVKEQLRYEVLFNGMTLRECAEKFPLPYSEDYKDLKQRRLQWLTQFAPRPPVRINYYIEGPGGIGKGLISRAIARKLIDPQGEIKGDENIFFEIGGSGAVTFEGYDGQPVIIWNDCRAWTLLDRLGGRENVFNTFDLFPPDIAQNIKYSSVRLANIINIVNSVQPWREFMDGLAGEYTSKDGVARKAEDKSQSYRRFPFFIVLHEKDFDLQMNKGVFEGTREYEQYMAYARIRANFKKVRERCGDNLELIRAIDDQTLEPVKQKYDEMRERLIHKQQGSDAEIMEEFKDYGKQIDLIPDLPPETSPVDPNAIPFDIY